MSSPHEADPTSATGEPVSADPGLADAVEAKSHEADESSPERVETIDPLSTIVVRCPACGSETLARSEEAGKRGRCAVCGETFQILPPPGVGLPPAASEAADAPPFEGPPHRAPTIVAVGTAAIAATAIATVITACCPYVPVDFVGMIVGIAAVVMARRDLRAMDRGEMDPAGRERTRLGFALGLCAAAVSGFMFLLRFFIITIAVVTAIFSATVAPAPPPPPPNSPPVRTAPAPADSKSGAAPAVPLEVQDLER